MKKSRVIIVLLLVISLITVVLYQTLATDITMNKTNVAGVDLSYTFDITDTTGRVVNVNAGATKILDLFLTNNNNGTISYGIAYTPSSVKTDDITIAELSGSRDSVSGTINKNEKKQITIVIVNNGTSDISLTLVPIAGYEHGGDLIVPSNHTLISGSYEIFEPVNASEYITSLVSSNPDTMNNDDPDGNVRYMGANPNNYVLFNNELWRIIGVFDVASTYGGPTEKRLKIIRDESIGTYSWDNKPSGTGSSTFSYGSNDWTDSALMEVLNNGAYWNRTSGTCPSGSNGATTSCDFSSIGLTEEAKALIGDAYWHLGGTASFTSASNGLASHFYGYERGTTVYSNRPTYWVGKIGLMYPSDYGYATSGGTTTNRESCLAKEMISWNSYSDCKNNDYLYNSSSYQWTLTPNSRYSYGVFYVNSTGYLNIYDNVSNSYGSRPVLYLKSTVEITGGEGSQSKPYTLDVPSVPATETISNIYTNAEKTTVANNSIEYQYATSVGMMEDVGGNIRYYGANPNNYVSFNNELWRIIGVFNDIDDGTGKTETRLKIARNESIGSYAWDSNKVNEWPTATLQTYLNGDYLNGLTSEAQGMVGNAKWNLGGSSTHQGLYANDYYTFERGTTVYSGRSTEWTGKIALMYPSDYMYAGDLSKCSKDGYNWRNDQTNCRDTSWLRNTSTAQWTLTPPSSNFFDVFRVGTSGYLSYNGYNTQFFYGSRPVLYLASTVEITGGDGTSKNPFTLS